MRRRFLSFICTLLLVFLSSEEAFAYGTLTVAVEAGNQPFSQVSGEESAGYDIDLWMALAQKADVEIRFVRVPLGKLADALRDGTAGGAILPGDGDPGRSIPVDTLRLALFGTKNALGSPGCVSVAVSDAAFLPLGLCSRFGACRITKTREEAIEGAREGAPALIPEYQGLHLVHGTNASGLSVSIIADVGVPRRIVLAGEAKPLLSALRRAYTALGKDGTISTLHDHWFSIYENGRIDTARFERGMKVIAVAGGIAVIWIFALRCRVRSKTRELSVQLAKSESAEREVVRLNSELLRTQSEIAYTLGEVIETRSHETANHVRRVAAISEYLAMRRGVPPDEAKTIGLASSFHDVGKIGIPDAILNKPGRLSAEEFERVKTHTTIGYRILSATGGAFFDLAATIALEHHERWNGGGYPNGLNGTSIRPEARIVAIADVFDALSGKRVYKPAWPLDQVIELIMRERGGHFEPALVDLFIASIDDVLTICREYPDAKADSEHPRELVRLACVS